MDRNEISRRRFIKRCVIGGVGLAVGSYTAWDFFVEGDPGILQMGFRNDAPDSLWRWSCEASWYEASGRMVRCLLCPHECLLNENDRGFCRVRVVKDRKLHTLVYGNPCSVHLDPVEKKPLFHFLPGTPIFSVATAGCNLRCLNCQNWEISQAKPEETENFDLMPEKIVQITTDRKIPSIAYTYSEPLIFYEYVRDTAESAKMEGIRNVLVTAGYILEEPLRELCRSISAVTLDVKGFNNRFYKKITGSRVEPILKAIEIMREEGVWVELSRLVVPTLSDGLDDIRELCRWVVRAVGPETPFHFLRFHPAHRLKNLPSTPLETMNRAWEIAREEGLHYVYIGNVPGHPAQDTICPKCGEVVIHRSGYSIVSNKLTEGRCPCGRAIAGVWV